MEKSYKREVAYKVRVSDLINGTFVRNEGFESNYITINGVNVSRVNVIGTIIDKNVSEKLVSIDIDDGNAQITVSFFENLEYVGKNLNVGESVVVIGRVNEYNGIKINGEIIKKIDKEWIDVRKKELEKIPVVNTNTSDISSEYKQETTDSAVEEEIDFTQTDSAPVEEEKEEVVSPYQKIWEIIKNKDNGEGVNFDIIKEECDLDDEKIEDICRNLLKEGEIYEIKAGYYKVLE